DLDAEFMAGDSRVAIEGHFAQVATDVGPADADAVDADEGFAGPWPRGFWNGDGSEATWLFQLNGVHARLTEGDGVVVGREAQSLFQTTVAGGRQASALGGRSEIGRLTSTRPASVLQNALLANRGTPQQRNCKAFATKLQSICNETAKHFAMKVAIKSAIQGCKATRKPLRH